MSSIIIILKRENDNTTLFIDSYTGLSKSFFFYEKKIRTFVRFTFTNCDSMARRCVAGVVAAHSRLVGVGVLGSSCTWRVHFVFILGGG